MKRWYEVSEEDKALMVERHKRGDSFSEIGHDMKIDRRAVAKIVRQGEEIQSGRLTIRRDELAELFHGHLADMKKGAAILLDVVLGAIPEKSLIPSEAKVDIVLDRLACHFKDEYRRSYTRSLGMPLDVGTINLSTDLSVAVELRLGRRRGEAAFNGLKEHIVGLDGEVKTWERVTATYKQGWKQLKQLASKINVPDDSLEAVVRLAQVIMPKSEEEDSIPRFTERKAALQNYAMTLLRRPEARPVLQAFYKNLDTLQATCEKLELLLSSPQIDNALVTSHCRYCPVP